MKFDYTDIPTNAKELKVLANEKLFNEKLVEDVDLADKKLFSKLEKLGWEMVSTCVAKSSLSLSAPQVGVFENIFVAIDFQKPNIWQFDGTYSLFINPVIVSADKSDIYSFPESCLSFKQNNVVKRPRKIVMSYWYYNEKRQLKQSINEEFEGYPARLIQHEYDHVKALNIEKLCQEQHEKPRRGRPPKNKKGS